MHMGSPILALVCLAPLAAQETVIRLADLERIADAERLVAVARR